MEADMMNKGSTGNSAKPAPGVIIKNDKQIEGIRRSSRVTREILDVVDGIIEPGISTEEINIIVHEETLKRGGTPAPLNYHGFPKSVCTSINSVICHGIPGDYRLVEGDIINVDVTTVIDGYYGDASRMYAVGSISEKAARLIEVTRECLDMAIKSIRPYLDISIVGDVIQAHADKHGYSIVRDYGGHGIGTKFHEEPHVHHYRTGNRGIPMLPGMTFTIEPMINEGTYKTKLLRDNWTVLTADGGLSAQWEHTILVTETGCEVLTG